VAAALGVKAGGGRTANTAADIRAARVAELQRIGLAASGKHDPEEIGETDLGRRRRIEELRAM